jgi:hypothetical protein
LRIFVLVAVTAAVFSAHAAAGPRLYVGLFDDRAFRWQPNRAANLDLAQRDGVSVIRTIVDWSEVAPKRPRDPASPFARGYRLNGLDDLVRNADRRGIEVLLTIWGTPRWANGGANPNVAPIDPAALRDFAHALAARYSGRYPGFPLVRFFSVWNEPNSSVFLSPQFDPQGRPVAPRVYASLVEAAYAGIKQADPDALVAAGETAPRGYDRHVERFHDSESPGAFARLVARADPRLPFDSWAHHPYPRSGRGRPDAPQVWPDVGFAELTRFEGELSRWFDRPRVELWLTEFAQQAAYLRQAVALASAQPAVEMFIWFGFRDHNVQASLVRPAMQFRETTLPLVQQGAKLAPSDTSGAAGVGAVALSADGTIAVVGGAGDDEGAGASWFLTRTGPSWRQVGAKLLPSGESAPQTFGRAVALSANGKVAAIAGFGDDGNPATWIFTRAGATWTQTAKLMPSDASGQSSFGVRLALSSDGTTLLIGGHEDAGGVGAAWVFTRSGITWAQQGAKLVASDERGHGGFGIRVALSADGSTALIGGMGDGNGVGAAWVFSRSGSKWTQQGPKLAATDERGAGTFGGAVALSADGDTALIGAENDNNSFGAAWVFVRSRAKWRQFGPKLTAQGEDGNGFFGKCVALSADGTLALIGGQVDNSAVGAAWVFAHLGASWTQRGPKLTAAGESGAGEFGAKLALSADGRTALIAAIDDDHAVGALWSFTSPVAAIMAPDGDPRRLHG